MTAATTSGVTLAIGCDWGPSGTKNLLGELKIAKLTSAHLNGAFTDEQFVRMVTTAPARMMGWDTFVGVDDTTFVERLKANANLSEWLRTAF